MNLQHEFVDEVVSHKRLNQHSAAEDGQCLVLFPLEFANRTGNVVRQQSRILSGKRLRQGGGSDEFFNPVERIGHRIGRLFCPMSVEIVVSDTTDQQ